MSINLSGSLVLTGSLAVTGEITMSGSIASASYAVNATSASYAANATSASYALTATSASFAGDTVLFANRDSLTFASTGSNTFVGTQTITGSVLQSGSLTINGCITSTGQIVAQTINVQQVTSSIVYSCGSNIFGSALNNTQTFCGNIFATGSIACFAGTVCAPTFVGGTVSGTTGTFTGTVIAGNGSSQTEIRINSSGGNNEGPFLRLQKGGANIAYVGAYSSIISGTSNDLTYYAVCSQQWMTNNSTATKMLLDASGNLGLGVTPSAWYVSEGYRALQVGNASLFGRNSTNSELYLSSNTFDNSSGNPTYITSDFATRYYQNDGLHAWLTAPSGTAGCAITFTQAMTLASTGNLLIGTTTDAGGGWKLQVNGSAYFTNTNSVGYTYLTIGNSGASGRSYDIGVGGNGVGSPYQNSFYVYDNVAAQPRFYINSTGAATFSSTITGTTIYGSTAVCSPVGKFTTCLDLGGALTGTTALFNLSANSTLTLTSAGTNASMIKAGSGDELYLGGNDTWQMRFNAGNILMDNGGNVGIGTSSPASLLSMGGVTSQGSLLTYTPSQARQGFFNTYYSNSEGLFPQYLDVVSYGQPDGTNGGGVIRFLTNPVTSASAAVERMRITSGGFLKASNTGTYFNAASYHELRANTSGNWVTYMTNTASTDPYGLIVHYTGASPNGTQNEFFYAYDTGGARFGVRSNGGIANYQANDVNLSDIRTKKDIIPLESYWNKFKAIEVVKFKYKDQTHDDFNIGVIAQQVEEIAPEFVDVDGFGETPEDGIPLKTVYTADLYHTTIKVLQEAMAKIETLEARVKELENK